jgi:hypothetical protein
MLPCHDPVLPAYMYTQVSLIRKSEAKRRKAAALRREEERVLRAEQSLKRSAEREAERKERIAGEICTVCRVHNRDFICSLALIKFHSSSITLLSSSANKARKAQEKMARAEVEQGQAAAQAKATAVRRNVAQKAPVADAPLSELQKKLMARSAQ